MLVDKLCWISSRTVLSKAELKYPADNIFSSSHLISNVPSVPLEADPFYWSNSVSFRYQCPLTAEILLGYRLMAETDKNYSMVIGRCFLKHSGMVWVWPIRITVAYFIYDCIGNHRLAYNRSWLVLVSLWNRFVSVSERWGLTLVSSGRRSWEYKVCLLLM